MFVLKHLYKIFQKNKLCFEHRRDFKAVKLLCIYCFDCIPQNITNEKYFNFCRTITINCFIMSQDELKVNKFEMS